MCSTRGPDFCDSLRIMKKKTLQLRNSVNLSHVRLAFLLIPFACFALSPQARAVCQQGCDTSKGNTFLGDDALLNNTSGGSNTAVGSDALFNNTTGSENTASGFNALINNTTGGQNTAIGSRALVFNTTGFANTAAGGL